MPPVISKPAHATGTANCSADGSMIAHQSQYGNDGINENESNHFLDPNLVDIISRDSKIQVLAQTTTFTTFVAYQRSR